MARQHADPKDTILTTFGTGISDPNQERYSLFAPEDHSTSDYSLPSFKVSQITHTLESPSSRENLHVEERQRHAYLILAGRVLSENKFGNKVRVKDPIHHPQRSRLMTWYEAERA